MLKHLGNRMFCILIIANLGCKSKLELSRDKEREMYRDCLHSEVAKIINEYNGVYRVKDIDSTNNFYILHLYSENSENEVIGITNRGNCFENRIVIESKYTFEFSCEISTKGNYSLYIFEPDSLFYGHDFLYKIPLGDQEDYVNISILNKKLVLRILNIKGLCYILPDSTISEDEK
jgi:hypothetical protein